MTRPLPERATVVCARPGDELTVFGPLIIGSDMDVDVVLVCTDPSLNETSHEALVSWEAEVSSKVVDRPRRMRGGWRA